MDRHYQDLYAMLLDSIPSSVVVVDRALRVLSANRNFLVKGNRRLADTVGRRITEVFPDALLEQTELAAHLHQAFHARGDTLARGFTYRAPGVPLRSYYYKIVPFRTQGPVEAVLLLIDDISEQVRLDEEARCVERHLACVVACASDIVVSTDRDGRLISWNRAAERLTGYPAEAVKGRHFIDLVTPKQRAEACRSVAQTLCDGSAGAGKWTLLGAEGQALPIAWVCSSLFDGLFEVAGIVCVGRDLSVQRRMEWQLAQSQRFAALGVMAGGLAHELRNPLAICASYTQILLNDDSDAADRHDCLERIYEAVKRSAAVIDSLVRYARNPSLAEAFEPLDLTAVLNEALELLVHQARFQRVQLATKLPSQSLWVTGNAGLLQQLCVSLCLRAIDAMCDGGQLSVELAHRDMQAVIAVHNTPVAAPQAGPTTAVEPGNPYHELFSDTSHAGAGIDLTPCYAIVKQHLGSMEVVEAPGGSQACTVRLPAL